MKILDRFTGKRLEKLPLVILPGRYSLLEVFIHNGHSTLHGGDLVLDDGTGLIRIADCECQITSVEQSDDDITDSDLSAEAIVAIAGKLAQAINTRVSPMLPVEIAAQCVLEEVERSLSIVLRDGHLHYISDRPRIDLKYDDYIVPVARARRLATSALNHLASHSDCWQQRTLSGIMPRKVLARFSDDDYGIYENRLYKRLLDRLDTHLTKRLARIRGVNSRLEKALEFQDSEQTHFRLRKDICKLWGESYTDDNTGMQLEAGKLTLIELESQLRAVRSLKQRGLYLLVPATAAVPAQVHRTNILNHDPHYRHLPHLWEKLRNDREDRQLTPEERLVRHQQLQAAFSSYVGLVLMRALERYGLSIQDGNQSFLWAGKKFSVKQDVYDWIVEEAKETRLRFVPITWFGTSVESENMSLDRVLCWPGTINSISTSQNLPISPLDLYVVEKMGKLIDEWLLRQLLKNYGQKLGPLPTPVKRLTDNWGDKFESLSSTHVRLMAPLDEQQNTQLRNYLLSSANTQLSENVELAIEQVDALSRQCGHVARFIPNQPNDFYCQCERCQATWSLKTSGKKRSFSMRPKGGLNLSAPDAFLWSGRDSLDFELE